MFKFWSRATKMTNDQATIEVLLADIRNLEQTAEDNRRLYLEMRRLCKAAGAHCGKLSQQLRDNGIDPVPYVRFDAER